MGYPLVDQAPKGLIQLLVILELGEKHLEGEGMGERTSSPS